MKKTKKLQRVKAAFHRLLSAFFVFNLASGTFLGVLSANAALVPANKVNIRLDGFNLSGAYSIVAGQPTGVGSFKNGNAGPYPEGSCVPSLIRVKNNDSTAGDIQVTPYYDYQNNGFGIIDLKKVTIGLADPMTATNVNQFTFSSQTFDQVTSFATDNGGTVSATITGPFSGNSGSSAITAADATRHYNVLLSNVPSGETVYVLFCSQLDVDATDYGGGASMSVRTGEGGAENVAMQAQQLLVLPKLTLTKVVSGGTATPDQWSFHVVPAINGVSDFQIPQGSDSVVIDNISPDGNYTITEVGNVPNYTFQSGSGTNCSFTGSTASSTVAAGKPPVNATCIFTNAFVAPPQPAHLIVNKVVVNDDGGTKQVADFQLFVDGNQVTSGQDSIVSVGQHTVSETADAQYVGTISGDCAADGTVTLAAGETKTCTITNNDIAPPFVQTTSTLMVVKQVVNNDGGTKTAADFTMNVTATNPSMASFPGSSIGTAVTVDAGAYSVDEVADAGYTKNLGADCSGNIAAGETKTCVITNDDVTSNPAQTTSTLVVVKQVVNDDAGTKTAADFTMNVTATNPSASSFPGDANGTVVTIDPGAYSVDEAADAGYTKTLGADCSGSILAGETKTCIITNNDVAPVFVQTTSTLLVIKQVVNDDGGTKVSSDFTMKVTATNPSTSTFAGNVSGTMVTIDAGAYSIDEVADSGYAKTLSADCSGNIAAGETKTCIVTNNDIVAPVTSCFPTLPLIATTSTGGELVEMATQGNFLYLADYSQDRLRVLDISDKSHPTEVGSVSVPKAAAVAYAGNYVYVTQANPLASVAVVDVSQPQNPTVVSQVAVGSDPEGITIDGGYAYVTSRLSDSIAIVDITNPLQPTVVRTLVLGSNVLPVHVAVRNGFAYVATNNKVVVIDASNPASAQIVASISMPAAIPHDIEVQGDYAYVRSMTNGTVQVVDITDPLNATTVGMLPTGGSGFGDLLVSGHFVYSVNPTDNTISVINVADPSKPVLALKQVVGNDPEFLALSGKSLFISHSAISQVSVYDISGVVDCVVKSNADVMIAKAANPASVTSGSQTTFTLTVTNLGPITATQVVVQDPLPADFTFVSSQASQGSYDSATGQWTIGTMAVNATATLDMVVTVKGSQGSFNNSATVSSLEIDPNIANNTAIAGVTVTPAPSGSGGGGNGGGGGGGNGNGGGGGAGGLPASSGGGATGFAPPSAPASAPAPAPIVLGVVDVAADPAPVVTPAPTPRVLGAVDELPRTGVGVEFLGMSALLGLHVAFRKRKAS